MKARTPNRAGAGAGILALLLLAGGGCAVRPLDRTLSTLSDVSADLITSLEERTDLQKLRVLVYEIHRLSPVNPRVGRRHGAREAYGHGSKIGSLLEHEFVVHLSRHLNIVESEHTAGHEATATEADLKEMAEGHGANAVLAGDYMEIGDDVYVSIRIVDVESMVVLGAARGIFDSGSLRVLGKSL